jgi:NAD-dependent DNA ligase
MPVFRVTKQVLDNIKKNPSKVANELTVDELVKLMTKLSDAYYNTDTSLVDDKTYDILFDILKEKDPDNDFIKIAGTKVKATRRKVNLPYPMGSLDKIKPNEGYLEPWLKKNKGPYIVSDKLDGVSAQIYRTPKGKLEMYTRGEGTYEGNIGEDITHLLEYINAGEVENIPKDGSIRGELIMSRENFDKIKDKYKNSRNTVSGVVNSKVFDKNIAKMIDFVSYSILNPHYKQDEQMKELKKWKINVVTYKIYKELTEKILEDYLKDRRKNSEYDVDGIVVVDSSKSHELKTGNPTYAFAFKMILDDQYTIATVKEVVWEVSMDSIFKPVVEIKPVNLVGTTVSRATAHNAKFVDDNKLGKGAEIKIIRSGDVIPYIMEVVKPAKKADMPDVPYIWGDSEVDIFVDYSKKIPQEIKDQVTMKLLTYFFRTIGVKYLSEGIMTKLVDAGYKSVSEILGADKEELTEIDGLGTKIIEKIYKEIDDKMKEVELHVFMSATHAFGRGVGERKLREILRKYPNIIHEKVSKKELTEKILQVEGFSDIMTSKFVDNLEEFKNFCDKINKVYNISHIIKKKEEKVIGNKLKDQIIVFTGVRDKELERNIEDNGGKVTTSVSKNTTILIHADDDDKNSSKYKKAVLFEIKTMTITEFKKKYNF